MAPQMHMTPQTHMTHNDMRHGNKEKISFSHGNTKMAELRKLLEDLIIIENNNELPEKLKKTLKKLKHGLGELIKEDLPPFITELGDYLIGGSVITGFECEDYSFSVFVDFTKNNGQVEKQTWKIGTRYQLEKDLLSRLEEDDETLGLFKFETILLHCDKFDHLNHREKSVVSKAMDEIDNHLARSLLYKALLTKKDLKNLLDYYVGAVGWSNTYKGYGGRTDEFEFEGEQYIYFRLD